MNKIPVLIKYFDSNKFQEFEHKFVVPIPPQIGAIILFNYHKWIIKNMEIPTYATNHKDEDGIVCVVLHVSKVDL